jgi:hypothetical protein
MSKGEGTDSRDLNKNENGGHNTLGSTNATRRSQKGEKSGKQGGHQRGKKGKEEVVQWSQDTLQILYNLTGAAI